MRQVQVNLGHVSPARQDLDQRWVLKVTAAGSGQQALAYLSAYVFKTATGNRRVSLLPDGRLRWPFRNSRTRQWDVHTPSITLMFRR